MENTTQTPGAANAPIKFSRKLQNFNVLANNGAGEFVSIKTTGYKTTFNGVLLGIQKQEGTHEKIIVDLETGLIIFKIKNLKQLTFKTLEKWINRALPVKEKMQKNYNKIYGGVSALDYYKNIVKNI